MLIYAKLSNRLSKTRLFYASVLPFLLFFGVFVTVLYPARNFLHPHAFCDKLATILPLGAKGVIAIIRNWTYTCFYVMAELWGSVALSLLFWGFANDITKISESKRFYALFGLFANFSLIISGGLVRWSSQIRQNLPPSVDPWQISLNYLIGMVIVSGLIILGIYWWINRHVLTDPRFYSQEERSNKKKEKPKLSLKESFLYLIRSKYLGCIAVLVIAYGISINVIEVTWKAQLHIQYPDPNVYSMFMGRFSQITGLITIFMMLFVGGNAIRFLGWKGAALITPITILITGAGFFTFIIFKTNLTPLIASIGTTPLMLAVVFGTIQNILSKSSKYSLFDPTKEMTYIPLDQEQKIKGKAAVDVVGARLGKSGGALVQQGLILILGSIGAITPYVAGILLVIILLWIVAVKSLNKQFLCLTTSKRKQCVDAPPASITESDAACVDSQVEITPTS